MNTGNKPNKVEISAVAADGGTLELSVTCGEKLYHLYMDNRINTETPKEIYTAYPGSEESLMLDSESIFVKEIKRVLESEDA